MRILHTPRLTLEPQTARHAEAMFAVLCDPRIYAHENAPPVSIDWLRERFARLESRQSPDGREGWLNWVLRGGDGELIGYVQATVLDGGDALVAYELGSAHWGRGLAHEAVTAMLAELAARYQVRCFIAVLKRSNLRSRRLLDRLRFALGSAAAHARHPIEVDEWLMVRSAAEPGTA